jgi:hypothetical protein
MQLLIKTGLRDKLAGRVNCRIETWPQESYMKLLEQIEGTIREVDTEFLFQDQYNLVDPNLRVMAWMVEKVIDDARINRMRCAWCGHNQSMQHTCEKCGHKTGTSRGSWRDVAMYHEVFTGDPSKCGLREVPEHKNRSFRFILAV